MNIWYSRCVKINSTEKFRSYCHKLSDVAVHANAISGGRKRRGQRGELGRLRWALVGYIARQLLGFGCVPAACPPPVVERL